MKNPSFFKLQVCSGIQGHRLFTGSVLAADFLLYMHCLCHNGELLFNDDLPLEDEDELGVVLDKGGVDGRVCTE